MMTTMFEQTHIEMCEEFTAEELKGFEPCGVCGLFGHKVKDHDD